MQEVRALNEEAKRLIDGALAAVPHCPTCGAGHKQECGGQGAHACRFARAVLPDFPSKADERKP
jgi:hypothetical protein